MITRLTIAACALAVALPLAAQQDGAVRERVQTKQMILGPEKVRSVEIVRRPRLGVLLDMQARATDSLGVYVQSVTPGGPAAEAGIQAGDVITKLDGAALTAGDTPVGASEERSAPALRLVERVARLKPGEKVKLEVLRGTEKKTFEVATRMEAEQQVSVRIRSPEGDNLMFGPGDDWAGNFRGPRGPGRVKIMSVGPDGMERTIFRTGSALDDLELTALNPDLGAYFGTTEGVLVLRAPRGDGLPLKGGDVILSVDGRKPTGPSSLLRILRSYDAGDAVKLEIMRNRKHETVSGRMPDGDRDDGGL